MKAPLSLRAATHDDRSAALWRITEAINAAGAALVDSRLFSNAAASLFLEVRAEGALALQRALEAAGLAFDDASVASLSALQCACAVEDDASVALYVTFIHNEPDLALEVPKVPG